MKEIFTKIYCYMQRTFAVLSKVRIPKEVRKILWSLSKNRPKCKQTFGAVYPANILECSEQ